MVTCQIVLDHLHRLKLLKACFLGYLILAVVSVMLKVAHISDVTHIAHLVSEMAQITEKHIKCDGRARMPQMSVTIYGGTAHIHAHTPLVNRLERLLCTCKGIVDIQHTVRLCHPL